jgi:hypothetical protein
MGSSPVGSRCEVISAPVYNKTGTVEAKQNDPGSIEQMADVEMSAKFADDPATGRKASCCEVRQQVRWNDEFQQSNGGRPPHQGFPADAKPGTWYEDRNATDQCRYGHRDQVARCGGDEYSTNGVADRANGDSWAGEDRPIAGVFHHGKLDLKLQVIDRCNGDQVKAESDPVTVQFNSIENRRRTIKP